MEIIHKNLKVILPILLVISVVVALGSLYHRQTGTDDAWLAEQAYWMAKEGYVRTELFYGMNNHHERHLTYHRMLIWHGVLAHKLFGWSPYVFKSISLLYFLLFIAVSYVYLRKIKILQDKTEYLVYFLLVLSMTLMVNEAFVYRSDIMAVSFGFMSFVMLHAAFKFDKTMFAIASAMFAGLSVVTHLNGMAFIFTGGAILLLHRRFQLLVWFSVAAIITSSLYFIEFRSLEMFSEFIRQFRGSPALREHDFKLWGPIYKLITFYKPYFFKGSDASYTLLIIFVFWTQRKVIFENEELKFIFQFFIILAVALVMISPEFKSLYLTYAAPYAFLLIAALFKRNISEQVVKARVYVALLCIFLLTQWGGTYKLFLKRTPNLAENNRQHSLALGIPDGSRIIAPLTFIFNEIDRYTIQSFFAHLIISGQGKYDLQKDFFHVAAEEGRTFIILSDVDIYDMKLTELSKEKRYGRYRYLGKIGQYHNFKLIS